MASNQSFEIRGHLTSPRVAANGSTSTSNNAEGTAVQDRTAHVADVDDVPTVHDGGTDSVPTGPVDDNANSGPVPSVPMGTGHDSSGNGTADDGRTDHAHTGAAHDNTANGTPPATGSTSTNDATTDNGVAPPAPTGTANASTANANNGYPRSQYGAAATDIRDENSRPQAQPQGSGNGGSRSNSHYSATLLGDPRELSPQTNGPTGYPDELYSRFYGQGSPHMAPINLPGPPHAIQGNNNMMPHHGMPAQAFTGPPGQHNWPAADMSMAGASMACASMAGTNTHGQSSAGHVSQAGNHMPMPNAMNAQSTTAQPNPIPLTEGALRKVMFDTARGGTRGRFPPLATKVASSARSSTPTSATRVPKSAGSGSYVLGSVGEQSAGSQASFGYGGHEYGPREYPAGPQQPVGGQPSGFQPHGHGYGPQQHPAGPQHGFQGFDPRQRPTGSHQPTGTRPSGFEGPGPGQNQAGAHQPMYQQGDNSAFSVSHPAPYANANGHGRDVQGPGQRPPNISNQFSSAAANNVRANFQNIRGGVVLNNVNDVDIDVTQSSAAVTTTPRENQQHHHRSYGSHRGFDGPSDEPQHPNANYQGIDPALLPPTDGPSLPDGTTWAELMSDPKLVNEYINGEKAARSRQDADNILAEFGFTYAEFDRGKVRLTMEQGAEFLEKHKRACAVMQAAICLHTVVKAIREGKAIFVNLKGGQNSELDNVQLNLRVGMAGIGGQSPAPPAQQTGELGSQEVQESQQGVSPEHAYQGAASGPAIAGGPGYHGYHGYQAQQGFPPPVVTEQYRQNQQQSAVGPYPGPAHQNAAAGPAITSARSYQNHQGFPPQAHQFSTSPYPGPPHPSAAFAPQHTQHAPSPRHAQQAQQFTAAPHMSHGQHVPATRHLNPGVPAGHGSISNVVHPFRGTPEDSLPGLNGIPNSTSSSDRKRDNDGTNPRAGKRTKTNANSPVEFPPAERGF